MKCTLHVEVVAKQRDFGDYTIFVFRNLDPAVKGTIYEYHMCVKLPNWEMPFIKEGDRGYVKMHEVIAGEDTWYDKTTGQRNVYLYDNVYIDTFVLEQESPKELIL